MVDHKIVAKFSKLSRPKQEMVILDRDSVADVMRNNLAADIVNGRYGLSNVTRQVIAIEDYEATTRHMRMIMKSI